VGVEKNLISRVILHGEMKEATEAAIDADLFEGQYRDLWKWCREYYMEYGESPGKDALLDQHASFEFSDPTEGMPYYADKLRERFTYNTIESAAARIADFMRAERPFKAADAMREALALIDDLAVEVADVDWTQRGEERLEEYKHMKEDDGVSGYATPFPTLNVHTQGIHDEELILILAQSGVGKTWLQVIMAHKFWQDGLVCLFISNEMASNQIERRLDALNSKLPYQRFRGGHLSANHEMRWKDDLSKLPESTPFYIVSDNPGGASKVIAKIDAYRPDVVFLDGAYLMDDDRNAESGWKRMNNVVQDLKKVAKRKKVPVIISSQLNADMSPAFYKGIRQDADTEIKLAQTKDQKLAGEMTLNLTKSREGTDTSLRLLWDHERMLFAEMTDVLAPGEEPEITDEGGVVEF